MKARAVDYITSNEEHVRMQIFDGDLRIDEAGAELLRVERAQHDATRTRVKELELRVCDLQLRN